MILDDNLLKEMNRSFEKLIGEQKKVSEELKQAKENASPGLGKDEKGQKDFYDASLGTIIISLYLSMKRNGEVSKNSHYRIRCETFLILFPYFRRLEWLCIKNSYPRFCYIQQIYRFVQGSLDKINHERSWWSWLNGCLGCTNTFKIHLETLNKDMKTEEWKNKLELEEALTIVLYLCMYFNQCDMG